MNPVKTVSTTNDDVSTNSGPKKFDYFATQRQTICDRIPADDTDGWPGDELERCED